MFKITNNNFISEKIFSFFMPKTKQILMIAILIVGIKN